MNDKSLCRDRWMAGRQGEVGLKKKMVGGAWAVAYLNKAVKYD